MTILAGSVWVSGPTTSGRFGERTGPVGVAVVGCGTVSRTYLANLVAFADTRVVGCADLDVARAYEAAAEFGVPQAGDLDTVLADPAVEIVVNLTPPAAHMSVATAAVRAGKHVYGEKPLALKHADGVKVLTEAAERALRVGNAPDTFLGASLQTCQRLVVAGSIGEPLSALACCQDPGPERWHSNPEFLYQYGAGPLFDVGPYYLTVLVQLLGPVSRVAGAERQARAERIIGSGPRAGTRFAVEVPTHTTALIEFSAGSVATIVLSFDSPVRRHGFVEITGTEATLRVPDPNRFDGPVRIRRFGDSEWREVPVHGAIAGRGLGVLDMARALRTGQEHRASGELALHIVETMAATTESARCGEFVPVTVGCPSPAPLPDDWNPYVPQRGG